VTTDSLVRIDPATGEAAAALALGRQPVSDAAGEGAVGVVDAAEQTLARIDPETYAWLAVGDGGVWAVSEQGRVGRVDPGRAQW
jgi:streptogramin lyase